MPLITVLTAIHPAGAQFLSEARSSVLSQRMPAGWELEWVVQEDGPEKTLSRDLADDSRIKYDANGAHLRLAYTRSLALARTSGDLVQNLDGDDILLPEALANLIDRFESMPQIHWAVGQADDLLPDGSRKPYPPDLPFGIIAPGEANAWAAQHGGNWPIHCAGAMFRTASLRALGGWAAVPFDEDLVMFAALSQITDGWFDESLTWLYRQHEGQLVRSHHQQQWSEIGRRIALQRARAVQLTSLSLSDVQVDPNPHVEVSAPIKTASEL